MKKLIVIGSGAISAFAISAVLGTGVAAADDYAGQSYADASSAASDEGLSVVVASRVGDKVSEDECLVVRSQDAPFTSAIDGATVDDTVQFYLNCNAGVASATTPGNSMGSAVGRETRAAELEAEAAQNEEDELAAAGETPGATISLPEG